MKRKFIIAMIFAFVAGAAQAADTLSIAKDKLVEKIHQNASVNGSVTNMELSFSKGKTELQTSLSEDIMVTSLEVDHKTKRFNGFLLIDGSLPLEVAGQYTEFVEVVALNRKMSPGEIIAATDVVLIEIDANKADRGFIVDEAQLVGQSPLRTIVAQRAIMPNQIGKPNLVENKKVVTVFYKNKFIQMQDMGIALDNGVEGDIVRVKNAASNIIISGRVVGESLVEVTPQSAILASR